MKITTLEQAVEIILQQQEQIKRQQEDIQRLKKEVERLSAQLRKYHNENTPSGALPPYLKDELRKITETPGEEPQTKSAKANGRNRRPKPDRVEEHTLQTCPNCQNQLRELERVEERVMLHLILPEAEAVLHKSHTYFCDHCQEVVTPQIPDALPKSKFDLNICLLVLMLTTIGTTQRKTMEILGWFGVELCSASVNNILHRMQRHLGTRKYRELESDLKKSFFASSDETSWRNQGKLNWIWVVTNARTAFYRIFSSRSHSCAMRIPRPKVGSCDGYRAYDKSLRYIQRCWAHALRKVKDPQRMFNDQEEIDQFKGFATKISGLYHDAKHENRRGIAVRKEYDKKLKEILLSKYKVEGNLVEAMNYLLGYEGEWFTFLQFNGVESTNNRAERMLRPLVVQRRVSQHSWSEEGRDGLAVVQSIYQTCKLREEDFPGLIRHEIEQSLYEKGDS